MTTYVYHFSADLEIVEMIFCVFAVLRNVSVQQSFFLFGLFLMEAG